MIPHTLAKHVGQVRPSRRAQIRAWLSSGRNRNRLETDRPGLPATIEYATAFIAAEAAAAIRAGAIEGGLREFWAEVLPRHLAELPIAEPDRLLGETDTRTTVIKPEGQVDPVTIVTVLGWAESPNELDRLALTVVTVPRDNFMLT